MQKGSRVQKHGCISLHHLWSIVCTMKVVVKARLALRYLMQFVLTVPESKAGLNASNGNYPPLLKARGTRTHLGENSGAMRIECTGVVYQEASCRGYSSAHHIGSHARWSQTRGHEEGKSRLDCQIFCNSRICGPKGFWNILRFNF